jgi:hypothetical protein
MRAAYEHLRGAKDGTFVLSVRGTMSPMDIANAARGDELFTDLVLEPAFSHELLARITDLTLWYYRQLSGWADEVDGGRVLSYGGGWWPSDTLGHLSNDAALLCSPAMYDTFGFPYEKRLLASYGHALYHVHNQGLHYVPRLAALPHLSVIEVADDPQVPPCVEDLPRVFAATGAAGLMLHMNSRQLRVHIDALAERNVMLQVGCEDRADAEDVIRLVRDRSRPL